MKLLDDKIVSKHFKNTILKNIISNNKFDKIKIKELENNKVLIVHNRGMEATIYKIKLNEEYYIFKLYYHNFNNMEDRIGFDNEKNVLSITKKCIQDKICPNYIYCYKSPKQKNNYQYSLLEYADGTLYDFLNNFECTENNKEIYEKIIKSMLFQILAALLVLHEKYKIGHNDLHLKNIFYNKIDTNEIFFYKINDITYRIETHGYLFMLGDFGHSISYEVLKNKKSEYIKTNKLKEYYTIKSSLTPLVSENYESFKMLHHRIIKRFIDPIINDKKNLTILIKKKIISQQDYDTVYKYLINLHTSKELFNKRMIQNIIDNDYIDLFVLLPKYIINTYTMFKNIIPYIFTYTSYLQISYVLQMFYLSNKFDNEINNNIFTIQTTTFELLTNYRINMDIKKRMFDSKKYIEEFEFKLNELEEKSLSNFASNNKSEVLSRFYCKHGVFGIDYKNKYGFATILELSDDKKYKEDNIKIIKFKTKLTDLINNNICPHFFKTYSINSKFIIVETYNDRFRKIINNIEYKSFFDKIIESSMELKLSLMFQFIVTNLCIIKYFNIDQTDLYIRQNSFKYITINAKSVFKYKINGINYYIPTYGYLLILHSEDLFNLDNIKIKETFLNLQKEISQFYDVGNCLRSLQMFYLTFIKIKFFNLNISKSKDIVNIIEKNSNSNIKKQFYEFKKIIIKTIEESYSNFIISDSSKEEHLEKSLYLRYIDFIYRNDMDILKKYIDNDSLNNIIKLGTFVQNIVNENNINDVLEKYFNCFHKKLNTTHIFTL